MGKPSVLSQADLDKLKRLAEADVSDDAIGGQLGIAKQTVRYHRLRLGVVKDRNVASHRDFIPWTLRGRDSHHKVARILRDMSRMAQGLEPSMKGHAVEDFLLLLHREGKVVDYDVEAYSHADVNSTGFRVVPRDDTLDAPDAVVRMPR